ncbi:MAG: ABC-F family ATP-binding cassette domain-containing protein [Erysipelothrix sp.]|nr:ABC-F family ATP-binding cassette domain-containing protein [Erysipelothrix sp.]
MIYQIKDGEKQFLTTIVFDGIDFNIKRGEKVALVGRNGAGKTTLMRIIAGEEALDAGQEYKSPNFEVAYLSQSSVEDEDNTVLEEVGLVFNRVKAVMADIEKVTQELEASPEDKDLLRRYDNLSVKFDMLGGYNFEFEMLRVLTNFGFVDEQLHQVVKTLSGGEKTKVAFAKLLLQKPDLLLLDEPTNHLDLSTIEWLEGYLKQYEQALIIVSHDQMFIDTVVDKIWDIEYGKITPYVGNYSNFEVLKEQNMLTQRKHFIEQQKEIKRLEELIEKFRYNANKAAFAQSKIKYLERMDKIELDRADKQVFKANFKSGIRGSNKVLEVNELEVGYDHVLAKLSFEVFRGEKIAIIGDNGTGKSTFVRTIMEKIPKLAGEYLWGHSITKAYFDQELAQVDSKKTVLEDMWDAYPGLTQSEVRTLLGNFLFSADDVFKQVSVLSGGEKVRLSLLKVMLSKANTLVLDEPTNHLDILSKRSLADAMNTYDGTIIFVSHDRHFINEVASKVIILKDNKIDIFNGTYAEYKDRELNQVVVSTKPAEVVKAKVSKTYSNNWVKKIEADIEALETKIDELEASTFDQEVYEDFVILQGVNEKIDENKVKLEELYGEYYEYLESID